MVDRASKTNVPCMTIEVRILDIPALTDHRHRCLPIDPPALRLNAVKATADAVYVFPLMPRPSRPLVPRILFLGTLSLQVLAPGQSLYLPKHFSTAADLYQRDR
jgi:hypothetical protein